MELSVKERDYLLNLINVFGINPTYIKKLTQYDTDLGCEVGFIEVSYFITQKGTGKTYWRKIASPPFKVISGAFEEMEEGKLYTMDEVLNAKYPLHSVETEMGVVREIIWECPRCGSELGDFMENEWEYCPYCGKKLKMPNEEED